MTANSKVLATSQGDVTVDMEAPSGDHNMVADADVIRVPSGINLVDYFFCVVYNFQLNI